MIRILILLLIFSLSTPVWSQEVLTITDARKANPVAPYAYFLEDFSHKLTYERVSRLPLDSFQPVNRQGAIQLGMRPGTIWLRFQVRNQTDRELVLLSTQWKFTQLDVYVQDEKGQLTIQKIPSSTPLSARIAPIAQAMSSLGKHPRTVHLAVGLSIADFYNDYLQLTDIGYALWYQKQTSFWHGGLVGVYLLVFLFALVFYVRLRDPLIGWYAFFVFTNTHWFVDRSGYLLEFLGHDSWYIALRSYYPIHLVFTSVWAIFLVKFINLRKHAKPLYYLLIVWLALDVVGYLYFITTVLLGEPHSLMRIITHWLGIEYIGYLAITVFLLLIGVVYVSINDFKTVRWYALGFGIGLISMIIAILALYDISWLPHLPYNNAFFIGSVLEITILGFVLAERTSQHRRQQNQTQQQLITQLQENLRQRDQLLHIRDEIARNLHDEVGATLTSIAISAKLVQKKVGSERTEVTSILEQIQTDSQDTIHTIRDTVWALNPDNDAPEKLLERMRAVGFQFLANQDIALTFESTVASHELPAFSMEQRRNIYLIFKEVLHNIIKHAQATCVDVRIFQQSGRLHIRIADNGTGFELTQTGDGNGLKNFQKRASEGGFSVRVCSQPGQGTTVELKISSEQTTNIGDGVGH
ncbi:MAG: histidine kinase [Cytophagaceae bacterium]|nr:histidine kinase [Cytophagaceae bacterium]